MKIKITERFKNLINHMLEVNKGDFSINYILHGFPKLDSEGGLLNYKLLLLQDLEDDHRYISVTWNSGYQQKLTPYISGERLKYMLRKKKLDTQNEMCTQLFGEDWLDDDQFLSDEQLKQANVKAEVDFQVEVAENICKKILQDINDNNINNKFYGNRDENHKPLPPVDKGAFTVVDASGEELLACVYKDLSVAEIMYFDLLWNSKVTIPLSTIENIIRKAKLANVDLEIYKGRTDCNDDNEDCSMDVVTIFITPEGKMREERIHMY